MQGIAGIGEQISKRKKLNMQNQEERKQINRKRQEKQIQKILETGRGPKEINKISRKKTRIQKLRKEDGTLTSNREEVLKICSDFYQDLYSSRADSNSQEEKNTSPDTSEIPHIPHRVVEIAIKEMKKNKAMMR